MTSDGTPFTLDDLRRWVLAFRRACERAAVAVRRNPEYGYFEEFPKGQCLTSADLLAQFLTVELEVPQDLIRRCYAAERDGFTHGWLVINGFIVDITADQFDDGHNVELVSSDLAWHGTFSPPIVEDFSPAERDGSFGTEGFFKRYDLILAHLERSDLGLPPAQ